MAECDGQEALHKVDGEVRKTGGRVIGLGPRKYGRTRWECGDELLVYSAEAVADRESEGEEGAGAGDWKGDED
jgi:hypothetical protein